MSVKWEDPPTPVGTGRPGTRGAWTQRLAPLTERPGMWARVSEHPTAITAYRTVVNLRNGAYRPPAGRWEFRGAKTDDGGGAVYARYLGPEEAS